MPAEPSPLPSFSSSDEESFVVLGKSLCDVDPTPPSVEQHMIEVKGMSILEETKKLIKEELSAIEGKISGTSPHQSRIGESATATNGMPSLTSSATEKRAGADGITNLLHNSQTAMSSVEKPAGASLFSSMDAKEQSADGMSNKHLLQNSQMDGSSGENLAGASSFSSMDAKQQSVSFPKPPLLDKTFVSRYLSSYLLAPDSYA